MKNTLNYIVIKFAMWYYLKILHRIKYDEHASDYIYDPILVLKDQAHDDHIYHFQMT